MSDLKSKLPDLNELGSMAGKLYKDIKSSVCGIIDDYKQKHPEVKTEATPVAKAEVVAKAEELNADVVAKAEAVKAAKKTAEKPDVKIKKD